MNGKPYVGVWLDHRQAFLFWTDDDANIEMQKIESGYQEEGEPTDRIELSGESAGGGGVSHASLEHRRKEQLKHYYKKLDRVLNDAEDIYLFGPGQAKKECASKLKEDKNMRARIRGVENADKKMTEGQMAAKVRDVFDLPREMP